MKSLNENSTLLDKAEFIEQGSHWAGVETRSALREVLGTYERLVEARDDAERQAWKSLAGYKFKMFGYWAAWWVKANKLLPPSQRKGNPFRDLVHQARSINVDRGAA